MDPTVRTIPVHNVRKNNVKELRETIFQSIKNASFIAIDLEITGLGPRIDPKSQMEEKYLAYKTLAETRSILSLGLSVFKYDGVEDKRVKYKITVFDIMLFELDPFTVDPLSLQFLVNHGLDFNQLISNGVSFRKRIDDIPNRIFTRILESGATLAFHNGLIDLMFLYNNFYSPLPPTCSEFLANLSDLFQASDKPPISDKYTAAIIDTKFIAEHKLGYSVSFLEYVYRKSQRQNLTALKDDDISIEINFEVFDGVDTTFVESKVSECFINKKYDPLTLKFVCPSFSNHGFCQKRDKCPLDHDVEMVLDLEEYKSLQGEKGTKRKQTEISDNDQEDINEKMKKPQKGELHGRNGKRANEIGSHSAGMDAFMTGFACAFFSRQDLHSTHKFSADYCGRIPVSHSNHPLLIRTEQHIKRNDQYHEEKSLLIRKVRSLNHGEISL
ncbi:unnamed protein product [Bursaphelenchus xylophilus]|uniref:(pine wood nematode) hypothetical protein n=1 Tax=Bursaphelenchus xylophilus TaxID=6326 RepID=A0A1I7SWG2_BURXY|nr:unnamed protein product [Bursaphelenchus xylophilus]CAG9099369.1 unnamed protein product [Bursaphelenchus xylophilus]